MNNEIKEILNNVKKCCDITKDQSFTVYQRQDILALLDYITNLQQKYESSQITIANEWKKRLELEEESKHLENQITMLKQQNNTITEMGLNYKSRIDKAIEFVETNPLIWKPNMELTNLIGNPNLKDMLYYKPDKWLNKLHTILKGNDENEK